MMPSFTALLGVRQDDGGRDLAVILVCSPPGADRRCSVRMRKR
jgi:hypothetical protein